MKLSHFSDGQTIAILKQAQNYPPVPERLTDREKHQVKIFLHVK